MDATNPQEPPSCPRCAELGQAVAELAEHLAAFLDDVERALRAAGVRLEVPDALDAFRTPPTSPAP